jgi:hypothetical protein|tara:strand:- start:303 stop:446 length:144 start_codon:yes stop_codon:yes gene_type:complete
MISSATQKDWDDFWKSEDVSSKNLKNIWEEMENIEPLTHVTKLQRDS